MRNWAPTFPLLNRSLPETGSVPEDYEDWSEAELYAGRRFAQAAPTALPPPPLPPSAGAETVTTASLPRWLADAQWQATPGRLPELTPTAEMGPFERAAIRTRRSVIPGSRRRRPPMGPPFLDEVPQDYPSHLAPVPRAPDWEQTVTGPTPWSPLAKVPRATDWGQLLPARSALSRRTARLASRKAEGGSLFREEGFDPARDSHRANPTITRTIFPMVQ
jgi:hypothetical protein